MSRNEENPINVLSRNEENYLGNLSRNEESRPDSIPAPLVSTQGAQRNTKPPRSPHFRNRECHEWREYGRLSCPRGVCAVCVPPRRMQRGALTQRHRGTETQRCARATAVCPWYAEQGCWLCGLCVLWVEISTRSARCTRSKGLGLCDSVPLRLCVNTRAPLPAGRIRGETVSAQSCEEPGRTRSRGRWRGRRFPRPHRRRSSRRAPPCCQPSQASHRPEPA